MRDLSCGLLLYRLSSELEVFLVHPGGPYFVNKDDGAWGVPKGLIEPGEDRLEAARREFEEETGFSTPNEGYLDLGEVEQTRKTMLRSSQNRKECACGFVWTAAATPLQCSVGS